MEVRRSIAALDASAQKPSGHRMVIVRMTSGCGIVFVLACMTEDSMTERPLSVKTETGFSVLGFTLCLKKEQQTSRSTNG